MRGKARSDEREGRPEPCPICGKPAAQAVAPFCSQRCADIDLGRWLGERYVIPGPDGEPGDTPEEAGSH